MKKVICFAVMFMMLTNLSASTKRALVIGIGAYPKESGWAAINGDKDVPVVKEILKINGYNDKDIKVLTNQNATKKNIKAAIQNIAKISKPGDQIYIHFSGHGQQVVDVHGDEDDHYDEAWIPYDAFAKYDKGKYEGQNHILDDELFVWFSAITDKIGKKGHLTVAVDACHSGDVSRGPEDDSVCVRGAFSDGTRGVDTWFSAVRDWLTGDDKPQTAKERKVTWTMISACQSSQTNREYKGTGSLTTALRAIASDLGSMTAEEVRRKVRDWMRNVANFGDRQRPDVDKAMKDMPFL